MSTQGEEAKSSGSQRQPSDHLSPDLKSATNSKEQEYLSNNNSTKETTTPLDSNTIDNVDSNQSTPASTPTKSQQNSPTKSTPSKSSRNRKKTDAKRRNANLKKQHRSAVISDVIVASAQTLSANDKNQQKMLNKAPSPSHDHQNSSSSKENHPTIKPNPSIKSTKQMEQMCDDDSKREIGHSKKLESQGNRQPTTLLNQEKTPERTDAAETIVHSSTNIVTSNCEDHNGTPANKITVDSHVWSRKQRENRDLKEQLKMKDAQLQNLVDRLKQQMSKIKQLESSLVSTTRTCDQFEKLTQQELANRTRLENENENLNQTVSRLKNQINAHEKERAANCELIRTLNATLMERETEVSILKLKMTRMQTTNSSTIGGGKLTSVSTSNNASSSASMNRQVDPAEAFAISGRSNSEFCRNSYARSSMLAEAAASTRSSTSQLQQISTANRDASVWAKVPEELTPSKRPLLLERNFTPSSIYGDYNYSSLNDKSSPVKSHQSSTPLSRETRRYKTLPKSMKSPEGPISNQSQSSATAKIGIPSSANNEKQPIIANQNQLQQQPTHCLVTNLDESHSTSQSSSGNRTADFNGNGDPNATKNDQLVDNTDGKPTDTSHYSTISNPDLETNKVITSEKNDDAEISVKQSDRFPPNLPARSPSTPVKISSGIKKIFNVFRRTDSSTESGSQSKSDIRVPLEVPTTPTSGAFQRGATRSTIVALPGNARGSVARRDFSADKPFAEWDTDMLVDWLTTIGLSMYANQCRRWVKCGAHIMNATPAEVDKGLGITNHLHRKKLRLAISELNGDCDKITKAAAKLDYLWVARWLDDIGLPQYKEAFINARIDGRVLNYLTVEDLFSLGVKSVLHHSSIKCGIKVLRSINFELQLLKRRATADETEQMNSRRQQMNDEGSGTVTSGENTNKRQLVNEVIEIQLWTCHRVMEWLRMIDFAEFASNLRGSGVHGGLIVYEESFNIDTISSLLGIPSSRTLLRRHLATFFDNLIGPDLVQRKRQFKELSSNESLNPKTNFKAPKKSPLWFNKLKSSKVGQDGMDEYLCPMYPVEPQIIISPTKSRVERTTSSREVGSQLPRIPESIHV